MNDHSALLIIDIQNDFCPGGALAVEKGDAIVPLVNELQKSFKHIIATQDWHPKDQVSFASNHDKAEPYDTITIDGMEQVLWPDHCVQGTHGADFHPDLDTTGPRLIVRKGMKRDVDSYSAFFENDKKTRTGLDGYLKNLNISNLYLAGLATDYCVFFSAMDAATLGYNTHVIIDATKGIDVPNNNIEKSVSAMEEKGIKIIYSKELAAGAVK